MTVVMAMSVKMSECGSHAVAAVARRSDEQVVRNGSSTHTGEGT